MLRESETRLGLPTATQRQQGLRAAITNTENLIRAVPDSVSGRTGGSLVTDAQRTRLVGLERAPLDDAFRSQSDAYQGETSNINELKRQALQDTQLAISEDDRREESLKGLYDTLYGREQDELARKAAADQARMMNSLLGGGGGGGAAPAPNRFAGVDQPAAELEVNNVINNRDPNQMQRYIQALTSSAGYGNQGDAYKLELLKAKQPGLFKNGTVNTARLSGLSGLLTNNRASADAQMNKLKEQAKRKPSNLFGLAPWL